MNTFKAVALGLVAWGFATAGMAQTGRIVTIDMQKIFDSYHKTPVARAKLEETRDQFTKELQAKQEALNEKLAEMQKFQRDVEEYRRSHQQILEEQSLRMRQGILKEITDVVQKEARDVGYLFVIDKSGNTLNGMPAIVYAQDAIEITSDIIKILNKNVAP